jgi:glycosyltransferase involved in cell wall biosynthesis
MTILFLCHDASRSGAPLFLLRLLRWLRDNTALDFHVAIGRQGDLVGEFRELAPVHVLEPEPTLPYRLLRRAGFHGPHLRTYLDKRRAELATTHFDLIYANSIASAGMLAHLPFPSLPVLCHAHELEGAIRIVGVENIEALKRRDARFIAVSRSVCSNLVERHAISADRISVVYGFVPVPDASEGDQAGARTAVRDTLGISPSAHVFIGCGGIDPRKGPDLFLSVAKGVLERLPPGQAHFVWVGGSRAATGQMSREVALQGLGGRVHFVEATPNVDPYFRAADTFVLSSREDPFPLVMLEAALCGRPILCFAQSGGGPEFVESDAGFVAPGLDVTAMIDKAVALASDPRLCARLGATARDKVLRHYSLSVGAPKIVEKIAEALPSSAAQRSA